VAVLACGQTFELNLRMITWKALDVGSQATTRPHSASHGIGTDNDGLASAFIAGTSLPDRWCGSVSLSLLLR
jgi:hypothetical protein